jgi:hypothetical protein
MILEGYFKCFKIIKIIKTKGSRISVYDTWMIVQIFKNYKYNL